MKQGSTEYAIFVCFQVGMFAINYLEHETRLGNPDLNLPMSYFYGDIDWMDEQAGLRVVSKNRYAASKLSEVYFITNSDHHMYFDNPDEFAGLIINDIFFTEERLHLIEGRLESQEPYNS